MTLCIPAMTYFPRKRIPSIISAEGLNFCVRYGYRCIPFAIITGSERSSHLSKRHSNKLLFRLSLRLISISPLNVSLHLHS